MMIWLGVAGLAVVMGTATQYFLSINREKVPVGVLPHVVAFVLGITLSVRAMLLEPTAATVGMGVLSLSIGGLMLYLFSIRKLPVGALTARLGDAMPALTALDDTGAPFDLATLQGRRVLFKFFRGSW